jgi:hypothetical protein
MNTNCNLEEIVKSEMKDLINAYSLALVKLNNDEVLLKSVKYAIDITFGRDGVNVVYFDTESMPIKGYNILLFLIHKRFDKLISTSERPAPRSQIEFVTSEIRTLSQHLRKAGADILSGSKEWTASYSWPVVQPAGLIATLI